MLKKLISRFLKQKEEHSQSSIQFQYNQDNIVIDFQAVGLALRQLIDIIVSDFSDFIDVNEQQSYLAIKHTCVYNLDVEILNLFGIPNFFDGSMTFELRGTISQETGKFKLSLNDRDDNLIPFYKIIGSILEISEKRQYLLPQNMYDLLQYENNLNNNQYKMYKFIEMLQKDVTDKVKFVGLKDNDYINTVNKINIEIREDDENNLLLNPTFDDLPSDVSNKMENIILNANKHLLIPYLDKKHKVFNRYLLNEKDIKVSQLIHKKKKINKEDAVKFLSNPIPFITENNEEQEMLVESGVNFGYRIIGIGEPYEGYFGSVKIDTPLSQVLKQEADFIKIVDKEYIKEFIEDNEKDLPTIIEKIKYAKDELLPEIEINNQKINNYEYDEFISYGEKKIKNNTFKEDNVKNNHEVLQINANDDASLHDVQGEYYKKLDEINIHNDEPKNLYIDFDFTPKKHQIIALNWFVDIYKSNYKGCLLADDMGLGKTFQVISFINYLMNRKKKLKVLIVAPTILIDSWDNEFKKALKLESQASYNIKIIRGNIKALNEIEKITLNKRTKKSVFSDIETINFVHDYNIYITTYKTLQMHQFAWAFLASDSNIGIDCIIYDEAQNIKNPNALQTQAAKAISSLSSFNILLTGTPIENELRDIWCLFDVFDPLFFGSWKNFREKYVNCDNDNDIERRLRKKISNYMLRRLKKQVLDALPQKYEPQLDENSVTHFPPKVVLFNQKQIDLYQSIVNSDEKALARLRKLRLVSLHPILIEKETFDLQKIVQQPDILNDFEKTKMLINILDNIKEKNEKVIIFSISKVLQLLLQVTLQKKYHLDIHIINGDNNKSKQLKNKLTSFKEKDGFNIIILSTLAAGTGLTINEANHVIHYERHWNPAKEDQASDRVYRIGQDKNVYIYHLICSLGSEQLSFDEGLHQLIMNKKSLSDDTLIPTHSINEKDLIDELFQNETRINNMESINLMSDREFEHYVKEIFSEKGYSSYLTDKYPSEYGADVIAKKGKTIIALQCKHSKKNNTFDKTAVYQLHTEAKSYYRATKLIAITNSKFNQNAINLAKMHNIEIIDDANFFSALSQY